MEEERSVEKSSTEAGNDFPSFPPKKKNWSSLFCDFLPIESICCSPASRRLPSPAFICLSEWTVRNVPQLPQELPSAFFLLIWSMLWLNRSPVPFQRCGFGSASEKRLAGCVYVDPGIEDVIGFLRYSMYIYFCTCINISFSSQDKPTCWFWEMGLGWRKQKKKIKKKTKHSSIPKWRKNLLIYCVSPIALYFSTVTHNPLAPWAIDFFLLTTPKTCSFFDGLSVGRQTV